tara:strand:+ start:1413 stop:2009 length:597 start_codon:yes stop_codon:yes gene_type:complete
MNQPNWHRINIDISDAVKIDLKDYILSDPYRQGEHALYIPDCAGVWTLSPNTIFKSSFRKELFLKHKIQIDLAQIFYRAPHYQHPGAHVDLGKNGEIYGAGLNWTVGPDDAEMTWYKMPTVEGTSNRRSVSDLNMEWPLEQLTEIDRLCIGQTPTLIRTDIPHTVDMGNNERWLISARFTWHWTWDDYAKTLKDWIIE